MTFRKLAIVALAVAGTSVLVAAQASAPPADPNRRFLELTDFRLEGGAVLSKARIAYATFGA